MRKGESMQSGFRSTAFGLRAVGAAGAAVLLVALLVQGAGAGTAKVSVGHPCLVMTGSGDPAFTKNFNPYAGGGLPSNSIAQGAFYEPLIVVPAGGRKTIPWLARSWKWSNGATTLTNETPVGSGPFNVVQRFTTQDYVLGKNASYWQPGLPKIECLEYVQASSNDAALALIKSGQVDWTHNFVPNVDKAYTSKDPQHYHAFYSNRDYPFSLVFDDTQYPYSLVAFRQAISLAIDRYSVWKLGQFGF